MGLSRFHERYTTTFKASFVVGICWSGYRVEIQVKILHRKNTPEALDVNTQSIRSVHCIAPKSLLHILHNYPNKH